MKRPAIWVSLITATVCAWLPTPAAHACSPLSPSIWSRTVYPATGATAVPTNARVVVNFQTVVSLEPAADAQLRPHGGAESIAATTTREVTQTRPYGREIAIIIKPQLPLQANTTYEVLDRQPKIPCNSPEDCRAGALAPIATFTTGAAADTTPPVFAGLASLTLGDRDLCDSSSCCGPYDTRPVSAAWAPAKDDVAGDAVVYHVYGPLEAQGSGSPGLVASSMRPSWRWR